MKAKIGRRLTEEETKKAAVLAAYIDASPHEWPESVSEVALICYGYLDQQARIRELEAELEEARKDSARLAELFRRSDVDPRGYLVIRPIQLPPKADWDGVTCKWDREIFNATIDAAMKVSQ